MSFKTTLLALDGTTYNIAVTDVKILEKSSSWEIVYETEQNKLSFLRSRAVFSDNKFIEVAVLERPFPNDKYTQTAPSNSHNFSRESYDNPGIIKIKLPENFVKILSVLLSNDPGAIKSFSEQLLKDLGIPRRLAVYNINNIGGDFYIEIQGSQLARLVEIALAVFIELNFDMESVSSSLKHAASSSAIKKLLRELIDYSSWINRKN